MYVPFRKNLLVLVLSLGAVATPSRAELQWVTGGAPENPAAPSAAGGVKDTPEETGSWNSDTGNSDLQMSLLTTCTKIINNYPADSVNYFYLGQHHEVNYYAYFLLKPTTRIHQATVDWYNISGNRIGRQEYEFRLGFTERLLTLGNDNYQWFMVTSTIGIDRPNGDAHQVGLPRDPGMYTVQLRVDGRMVGITFFYIREPDKNVKPVTAVSPAASDGSTGLKVPNDLGAGAAGQKSFSTGTALPDLLMATPVSNAPLFQNPKK